MQNQQVILITGGAKRIGHFLAQFFIKKNWNVALHYHQSSYEANELKNIYPNQIQLFQADLNHEPSYEDLISKVYENFGHLDVLINNASIFSYDSIQTATRSSWDDHLEVNLRAPFVLSQCFFKHLSSAHTGCIINMIDQRVWNLTPHFMSYTLSKVGLWTLTQTMAMAMAPRMLVNGIGPGPVLPSQNQSIEDFQKQFQMIPLKHAVNPLDICKTAEYIIETKSLTGQMIAVDSGQHLGWSFSNTDNIHE